MKLKFRRIFCSLLIVVAVLFILLLAYIGYGIVWIYNFNTGQEAMFKDIPKDFYQKFPLIRDPNGYFGVVATMNGVHTDTLLLDTQASSSLAKPENLNQYGATYWGRKPIPTFNFYRQVYFSKIYEIDKVKIGNCALKGVLFNSVPKENGMYNALYRTVLGRTVIENMVWKFDIDKKEMILFPPQNKEALKQETEGFAFIKDGINKLPLYNELTDSLHLLLDLGSNYDIIIDKTTCEKLQKHYTPRRYINYRRVGLTDTIAEFRGITMYCNEIAVPHCTLIYIPTLNKNVAGQNFIGKINFVLVNHDLYVQQRTDTVSNYDSSFSELGLNINIREENICITSLEINGKAEKAGLKLGDKVISIEQGKVSIDNLSVQNGELEKHLQKAACLTFEIERNGVKKNILSQSRLSTILVVGFTKYFIGTEMINTESEKQAIQFF